MSTHSNTKDKTPQSESGIKGLLAWLAMAHGRTSSEDTEELLRHVNFLREAPIDSTQRVKLLDLLYAHADTIARSEIPRLNALSLPISRKTRQRVRLALELLETLAQEYFNTLASLFDPQGKPSGNLALNSLRRIMLLIGWQVRIYHLIASPPRPGLWQQLHSAFSSARKLGLAKEPGPRETPSIQRLYLNTLLAAIAQPASFSSEEQDFIHSLLEGNLPSPELSEYAGENTASSFWIDPQRDFPAHALSRRAPGQDTRPWYFSCHQLADDINKLRHRISANQHSRFADIPEFAFTRNGMSVLCRLEKLWGQPAKRRFPRRRQSYRARLCAGLDNLHRLLANSNEAFDFSEWMVTNESPDGFALMHMIGSTTRLRVGDIVSLQALDESVSSPHWLVCIIRWAISENPEHVEIGLQLLAPRAIPARIAQAGRPPVEALILPETPPLRPGPSLVVSPGQLNEDSRRITLLIEQDNLVIREVKAVGLNEQTSSVEIFPFLPEEGE